MQQKLSFDDIKQWVTIGLEIEPHVDVQFNINKLKDYIALVAGNTIEDLKAEILKKSGVQYQSKNSESAFGSFYIKHKDKGQKVQSEDIPIMGLYLDTVPAINESNSGDTQAASEISSN